VRTQARLAALYAKRGRADEAADLASKSETRSRKMGYKKGLADALAVLGDLAQERGEIQAARKLYEEARRLYMVLHNPAAARFNELAAE
jgi:tetratricopeptide (TPR) repeat protein